MKYVHIKKSELDDSATAEYRTCKSAKQKMFN